MQVVYEHQIDRHGRQDDTRDRPGPDWLAPLLGEHFFATVYAVNGPFQGSKAFSALNELRSIQRLDLHRTNATDVELRCLENLSELRILDLSDTGVSDHGLRYLRGLTKLEELVLVETSVADDGMRS